MKIYSDILTLDDLKNACPVGVNMLHADVRLPANLRAWRFDHVRLSSVHGKRSHNSGNGGAIQTAAKCASWDEHGHWMAELFKRDPSAIIDGVTRYDGSASFHQQTANAYA